MTEPAINLAAVARARCELARIVAVHPHLTSPEAQERLAAALPTLTESPMSKPLNPNHQDGDGAAKTVGVRLAPDMLAAVDAEVERLRALAPWSSPGRSDAVRSLLLRAINAPSTMPVEAPSVPAEAVIARRPSAPPPRASSPPSRPSAPPPRASVRPPVDLVVPASPRVPAELVDVAQVPANDPRQLSLIGEASSVSPPSLSVEEIRERVRAINKAGESFTVIAEATGVSRSSIHNFARGHEVKPKALAALASYVEAHG